MIKLITIFAVSFVFNLAIAQKLTRQEYIDKFSGIAIDEMAKTGIPASITLAQGILESGDGNSELATKANNHFGIKCHSDWTGKTYKHDDDKKDECFRVYKNADQSYRDHSEFLTGKNRYAFLFDLKPTDYKGWAKGLKKAGYATNPKYPELLIKLIEDNRLYEYDDPKALAKANRDRKEFEESDFRQAEVRNSSAVSVNAYYDSPEIQMHPNYIKFYKAKGGETYQDIANKFEMRMWQITKYNDLNTDAVKPNAGEVVYLQPKRWKAQEKTHIVQSGESLAMVSQAYGIKQKWILKRNNLADASALVSGKKIKLR